MQKADRDGLIGILSKEPVANCGFLEYLDAYELVRSGICGSSCGAVFQVGEDRWGALSSRLEEEAKELSFLFDGMLNVAISPAFSWSADAALGGRKPDCILHCTLMHLPDGAQIGKASADAVHIGPEYAETVYRNYKRASAVSLDYIKERLDNGPSIGTFRDGALVGWALTHDDFSMGMLTVLPEYRRQGIALDMTLALIEELRRLGKRPIAHIEKGNGMSMPLVRKLGFQEVCDIIFLG
ncbi:MAG TPA: GNAT family N-acetyltransferase [Bacillota bacterium]|nr:GNAT family N-acetyltransferase [Bacillota bacterium]